jgi:hypothetical protein
MTLRTGYTCCGKALTYSLLFTKLTGLKMADDFAINNLLNHTKSVVVNKKCGTIGRTTNDISLSITLS